MRGSTLRWRICSCVCASNYAGASVHPDDIATTRPAIDGSIIQTGNSEQLDSRVVVEEDCKNNEITNKCHEVL